MKIRVKKHAFVAPGEMYVMKEPTRFSDADFERVLDEIITPVKTIVVHDEEAAERIREQVRKIEKLELVD